MAPQTRSDPLFPVYFQKLNAAQRQAVEALEGPVLVLAGAGTGKTRVLTTRLAHLLQTGRAYPSQILSVTFTNKAAQEMKARVSDILGGQPVEGWWLGTFHSVAARMLRQHAEKVGLTASFTIIDADDQVRLMKQLCESEKIDPKKWPAKVLMGVVERWKDKALTPQDLGPGDAGDLAGGRLIALYRMYQDRLRTVNACDFGDLLLHMITILRNPAHIDALNDYHRRFKYILVDEYQDTNVAQYMWLRLLAAGSNNICCVGDDDQSIYGWRGAEITNILRFEKDFPNAKIIRLEQNYRSTGHILAAASGVIAHNTGRLGKVLWSEAGGGEKIKVQGVWDGEAEARLVSDTIEELNRGGQKLSSMAILVRAGFQMREFEDRFLQIGLPYRVFGGPRFYERAEIRDAMAYFRVVCQPHDDLALERVINTPKRGIGETTIQMLTTTARTRGTSLYTAIVELLAGETLKTKVRETLARVIQDFTRWRGDLNDENASEIAGVILDESGYMAMWQADKSPDAPGRIDNLKELVATIADYPSLPVFLEHVALVLDNASDQNADRVGLMTLHAAKGLEFDTVFLPGWEDGIFPSQRSMDENGLTGLEEERRLAYVGITRAKTRAMMTFVANRRQYGSWVNNLPSRFLGELPEENIEVTGLQGMATGHQPDDHYAGSLSRDARQTTSAYETRQIAVDAPGVVVGARVFHDQFGWGLVIHISGQKLDIKFDDGEMRRVMAGFVDTQA